MEGMQEECSLGAVSELEKIYDSVESMQDQCSLGLVAEVEPVNDAVEGMQEECFVRVAADLTKAKEMAKQLETLFAGEHQGEGGGGDAAAGAYQRARELTSTIFSSVDRALHMITSNRADPSPAAGQPGCTPSSDGDGSSRSTVLYQGVCVNAPGQSDQNRRRKKLPRWSPVRVSNAQAAYPDDGFSWRKYGQKGILGAKHPRVYYRCTHRHSQGCTATKHVQRTDDDHLLFGVMYQGTHTCTQGSGQFTQGQFERVSPKCGFNTPELESESSLLQPPISLGTFTGPSFGSESSVLQPPISSGIFTGPYFSSESSVLQPPISSGTFTGLSFGSESSVLRPPISSGTFTEPSFGSESSVLQPPISSGTFTEPSFGSESSVLQPPISSGTFTGSSFSSESSVLQRSISSGTFTGPSFGSESSVLQPPISSGAFTGPSFGSGSKYLEKPELKPEMTKLEPEPMKPVLATFPACKLFEEDREKQLLVSKIPLKLEPACEELKPEMTKLEPEPVKPVLPTSPASKLFGEDREKQLPVSKIPLKLEPVCKELKPEMTKLEPEPLKPVLPIFLASKLFGEDREKQLLVSKIPSKLEPDCEKPFQMESFCEEREKQLSATLHKPKQFWEEKPFQTQTEELLSSTPYKDVMAWFAMGKQRQIGQPGHTCMQKAGQELLLGRDDIRQKVMEKILLDSNGVNNCTVISIYGWSGLGKTSLLRSLYNDQQLLDGFDKRIWIQISEKVDMLMFFRKIIEFTMNEHCSITNINILGELVVEEITDKKFLLFLDDADIENQQFWATVLEVLNTGAKGSVVVMATRSSTVAAVGHVTTYSYSLNPLSEENNLMLLQQYAVVGTDIYSNPDLAMMVNRLIARFGYNLLYLKAVAGLLCHTDTFSMEEDKFEGSVMPLRLCHDALPVHLKRCLALCSLFPEGYIFDKHYMVLLWISHGCVRPIEGYELEDAGVEYFNELLCRSFFQCSPVHSDKDDMFVMHELMYNVVASVSHDKYFKSEDLLSSMPENVLHCSLVVSLKFQTVELMHRTEQLKYLQTFLVVQPERKPNNISSLPTLNLVGLDDFFLKFTSLETLDLSHTETEELPGSIGGLRNLRYLSVNSTNVRALPSELCNLSDLQTLEAKHCRFLTELPRDMRKLVKLRHLDLTKELSYVDLPRGIGELTELQTLPVFHVSGDLSHCSISELGSLHNLRGCLWLSGLENVKTGNEAQEANLKDKHNLNDLTLQWHDDGINIEDEDEDEDTENVANEQVLESLQPHSNLQVLTIRGYEGSRFPAWMQGSSPSLPNLVTLTLDSCCNCTEFPAIAQLPSLKSLSVRKMYDVRRLSSSSTDGDDGAAKFPSLELLNLWEMYGLEELFEESEGDCPRLRKVCISRCPDLKRLPACAPSLTELVLHCGGQQLLDISELASLVSLKIEGFHGVRSFGLPAAAALKKLEIRSCKELSSVDGLSALATVRRIKITGCPKLVLPETNSSLTA